jgi:hypothetical protein
MNFIHHVIMSNIGVRNTTNHFFFYTMGKATKVERPKPHHIAKEKSMTTLQSSSLLMNESLHQAQPKRSKESSSNQVVKSKKNQSNQSKQRDKERSRIQSPYN